MESNDRITVVYLMWLPYGYEGFRSFFQSYADNNAGVDHDLVILFKDGDKEPRSLEPYLQFLSGINGNYKTLFFEGGLDIDAYFYAAKNIDSTYIFFFNTSSVIKAPGWLANYHNAICRYDKVIVSATATNQSHYSNVFIQHPWKWETAKGLVANYRKYKLFIKAFFYWRLLFKPFPNPHIRTNAFLVDRRSFLEFYPGPVITKFKAYLFESGRRGFSAQLIKNGYQLLVIDKFGKTYEPREWVDSKTFWSHQQENLVVADNQTRIYDAAGEKKKMIMTKTAWGL